MFTGIVEAVGTVTRVERRGSVQQTTIRCPEILDDVNLGDSISIDGACQTVVTFDDETFQFDSVQETLRLTTIGSWTSGRRVNLERSLQVGARLGGHWVMGHVDAVSTLLERRDNGNSSELRFSLPSELASQVAGKGSVALDGISLTVTDVSNDSFGIAVIPFTLDHTTLGEKKPGDPVHIETDILAKYIDRLYQGGEADRSGVTMSLLEKAGFLSGPRE